MDPSKFLLFPNAVQDSLPLSAIQSKLPQHSNFSKKAEFPELNVFEAFFYNMQHPAIILDLNTNSHKAQPQLVNPKASSLISSCNNFFSESQLENFADSLEEFIHSSKRKVAQEICHSDLLHVIIKSSKKTSEAIFLTSAFCSSVQRKGFTTLRGQETSL